MGQDTEVNLRSPTREVYEELQRGYDHYNERLFGGQLPECVITLQRDNPRTYGYFSFKRFGHLDGAVTDEIALNPTFFAVVPLVETMQTLVHEMCLETTPLDKVDDVARPFFRLDGRGIERGSVSAGSGRDMRYRP